MGENNYDPEVYKRLKLVEKQFQHHAEEDKKEKAAERRQNVLKSIGQNKIKIGRLVTYTFLGLLVCAVIGMVVFSAISR
jgi:hypothetical protein